MTMAWGVNGDGWFRFMAYPARLRCASCYGVGWKGKQGRIVAGEG